MLIKEITRNERPRERANRYGIKSLSNNELLAVLLRTGTKDISAIEVGNNIINSIEDIKNLKGVTLEELTKIKGIGIAKAVTILASIELGKRVNRDETSIKVITPRSVYNYLKHDFVGLKQEHFMCLYLDTKNNLISKKVIFIGSLNMSLVHPREIFKWAVKYSSASIILVHNHPSGDSTPSPQDIEVTKKIINSGKIIGISVIDHIIIGNDSYLSLNELGYFK
ncbi:DNA repair protein RadC [Mycoplasmatota bacterium]|nr:DNA repair protein RadC [Mycoplasmatota bacterium]